MRENWRFNSIVFLAKGDSLIDAFNQAVSLVGSQHNTKEFRSLYHPKRAQNNLPWRIDFSEKQFVPHWNLPEAVNDPLYNLPKPKTTNFPSFPYPGLNSYEKDLTNVFWGRDHEIRTFYNLLIHPSSKSKIFLLYGRRGVGKSSFVKAGVIPRLENNCTVYFQNFSNSIEEITEVITRDYSHENGCSYFFIDGLYELNHELLRYIRDTPKNLAFVLVVPQILLNEWQEKIQEEGIQFQSYFLPRLTKRGIKQIIEGPTLKYARQFYNMEIDAGLSDRLSFLFHDDPVSNIAPILQFLMANLWKALKERPRPLSWNLYQELKSANLWRKFGGAAAQKSRSWCL